VKLGEKSISFFLFFKNIDTLCAPKKIKNNLLGSVILFFWRKFNILLYKNRVPSRGLFWKNFQKNHQKVMKSSRFLGKDLGRFPASFF
jgi:hypothetical protein